MASLKREMGLAMARFRPYSPRMRQVLIGLVSTSTLVLGCGDDGFIDLDPAGTTTSATTTDTVPGGSTTSDAPGTTSNGNTSAPGTDSSSSGQVDSSSGGPPIECGNNSVEGDEVCDGNDLAGEDCLSQGFDSGVLGCADDCSAFDARLCADLECGNDVAEADEACDGPDVAGATCASEGFDSGSLACANDCSALDTSGCGMCGNVIVDGDEVCDDIVLLGQSCVTQGFDSGPLACAPDCLSYDTDACGTCGNDLVDGDEFCDGIQLNGEDCISLAQGFDSGTLACGASCTAFDTGGCGTCGNDVVDGDEFCDGLDLGVDSCQTQGFDSGTLVCNAGCGGFDTTGCGTCGNGGIIDGAESCDGANLAGETCASLGLQGGDLSCDPATCQYDFSLCDIAGIPFGSDVGYNGFSLMPAILPCDDISATGTSTGLSDDGEAVFPMGMTFTYYGLPFTDITISANGVVYFNDPGGITLGNICMPGVPGFGPSDLVFAAFWDDLNPSAAGDVLFQTLGPVGAQRFVVQWDVPNFGGDVADLMRIQAVFNESGSIEVCYPDTINAGNAGDLGAEATAGTQFSAMSGFEFSCNMPNLVNGLMLMYLPI